ncbi:DUF2058 domain-containing protein [Aquisalimonas lutea]|uniref:DUF2058 domain-containing protein n=1 Tax=Aquisalimonas lutea TaxID=1327750 RepID=UPI0025B4E421|nr:DUF2058 domain-containing protein [Aquisalimonas lutea]MDN3517136.1 DUF2058 domain-containing protein [Aquisalimonas lutea]
MSNSLRDQLLQTGLVDEKKARNADKEKRSQRKKRKGGRKGEPDPEAAQRQQEVVQARREKAERDRELNRRNEQSKQKKSAAAQVEDLLREHAVSTREGTIPFHFTKDGKVRKIEVTRDQQGKLSTGALAIVERKGRFHVVPAEVVPRLQEREPSLFVALVTDAGDDEDDDLYKEFPIPDDLDW